MIIANKRVSPAKTRPPYQEPQTVVIPTAALYSPYVFGRTPVTSSTSSLANPPPSNHAPSYTTLTLPPLDRYLNAKWHDRDWPNENSSQPRQNVADTTTIDPNNHSVGSAARAKTAPTIQSRNCGSLTTNLETIIGKPESGPIPSRSNNTSANTNTHGDTTKSSYRVFVPYQLNTEHALRRVGFILDSETHLLKRCSEPSSSPSASRTTQPSPRESTRAPSPSPVSVDSTPRGSPTSFYSVSSPHQSKGKCIDGEDENDDDYYEGQPDCTVGTCIGHPLPVVYSASRQKHDGPQTPIKGPMKSGSSTNTKAGTSPIHIRASSNTAPSASSATNKRVCPPSSVQPSPVSTCDPTPITSLPVPVPASSSSTLPSSQPIRIPILPPLVSLAIASSNVGADDKLTLNRVPSSGKPEEASRRQQQQPQPQHNNKSSILPPLDVIPPFTSSSSTRLLSVSPSSPCVEVASKDRAPASLPSQSDDARTRHTKWSQQLGRRWETEWAAIVVGMHKLQRPDQREIQHFILSEAMRHNLIKEAETEMTPQQENKSKGDGDNGSVDLVKSVGLGPPCCSFTESLAKRMADVVRTPPNEHDSDGEETLIERKAQSKPEEGEREVEWDEELDQNVVDYGDDLNDAPPTGTSSQGTSKGSSLNGTVKEHLSSQGCVGSRNSSSSGSCGNTGKADSHPASKKQKSVNRNVREKDGGHLREGRGEDEVVGKIMSQPITASTTMTSSASLTPRSRMPLPVLFSVTDLLKQAATAGQKQTSDTPAAGNQPQRPQHLGPPAPFSSLSASTSTTASTSTSASTPTSTSTSSLSIASANANQLRSKILALINATKAASFPDQLTPSSGPVVTNTANEAKGLKSKEEPANAQVSMEPKSGDAEPSTQPNTGQSGEIDNTDDGVIHNDNEQLKSQSDQSTIASEDTHAATPVATDQSGKPLSSSTSSHPPIPPKPSFKRLVTDLQIERVGLLFYLLGLERRRDYWDEAVTTMWEHLQANRLQETVQLGARERKARAQFVQERERSGQVLESLLTKYLLAHHLRTALSRGDDETVIALAESCVSADNDAISLAPSTPPTPPSPPMASRMSIFSPPSATSSPLPGFPRVEQRSGGLSRFLESRYGNLTESEGVFGGPRLVDIYRAADMKHNPYRQQHMGETSDRHRRDLIVGETQNPNTSVSTSPQSSHSLSLSRSLSTHPVIDPPTQPLQESRRSSILSVKTYPQDDQHHSYDITVPLSPTPISPRLSTSVPFSPLALAGGPLSPMFNSSLDETGLGGSDESLLSGMFTCPLTNKRLPTGYHWTATRPPTDKEIRHVEALLRQSKQVENSLQKQLNEYVVDKGSDSSLLGLALYAAAMAAENKDSTNDADGENGPVSSLSSSSSSNSGSSWGTQTNKSRHEEDEGDEDEGERMDSLKRRRDKQIQERSTEIQAVSKRLNLARIEVCKLQHARKHALLALKLSRELPPETPSGQDITSDDTNAILPTTSHQQGSTTPTKSSPSLSTRSSIIGQGQQHGQLPLSRRTSLLTSTSASSRPFSPSGSWVPNPSSGFMPTTNPNTTSNSTLSGSSTPLSGKNAPFVRRDSIRSRERGSIRPSVPSAILPSSTSNQGHDREGSLGGMELIDNIRLPTSNPGLPSSPSHSTMQLTADALGSLRGRVSSTEGVVSTTSRRLTGSLSRPGTNGRNSRSHSRNPSVTNA